jgi:hypothetical protein
MDIIHDPAVGQLLLRHNESTSAVPALPPLHEVVTNTMFFYECLSFALQFRVECSNAPINNLQDHILATVLLTSFLYRPSL